ncbi:hypothetical protein Ahy_A05g025294 [Arachis hypogaea]|uniref:Uncharacterized protein n=1 Tax=Arachis hypogaea TaxID=3818 RepID=A0A445D8B3_ARAHY|nr:hypothetical protein Ahy_A05g025294 [Arachis hypogaea]
MERLKIIKRYVCFYEEMRSKHEDLILFFVLTLFVYFRDRSSGQLSLGGRMNSRIRCEALEHIVGEGDRNCIWELRMKTNAFANFCELLEVQGELKEDGHVKMDNKRMWTDEETNAFVGFMEEFVVDGQRADCDMFVKFGLYFHRHIQPSSIVLASLFLCFTGWRVYLVGIEPQEQVQLVALMRRNRFEDTVIGFNDSEMSPQPDIDERTAVQGQASHSEAGASGGSTRRYRRKRKHADVLERMADHIQQSSADQRKNV